MVLWNKNGKKMILCLEAILAASFFVCDLKGGNYVYVSSFLKFTSIIVCFFLSLLYQKNKFLKIGLFFTVLSDYFLLFTDFLEIGLISFLIVQIAYSTFLLQEQEKERNITKLLVRYVSHALLAGGIEIVFYSAGFFVDFLFFLTLFYFLSLLHNVLDSLKKRKGLFAIGMVLFLCCDIQVGIFNLSRYVACPSWFTVLYEGAALGMWLCYLPAKLCIALS